MRAAGALASAPWTAAVVAVTALASPQGAAAAGAAKLYWTLNWPHKIQRSNADGSDIEDLVDDVQYPHALAVDAAHGRLYWGVSGTLTDGIQWSNLDGSGVRDFIDGPLAWGIAVDAVQGKVYWSDMGARKIQRSDLNGSGVEDLVVAGLDAPAGLALDVAGKKMYWCDVVAGKVRRASLDGSGVEDLVGGLSYPQAVAVAAAEGKVYWSDAGTFKIQRSNLDGSAVEDIVTEGLKDPYGVAVDEAEGAIYFTSIGLEYDKCKGSASTSANGKIQRSQLDGSGIRDVVTTGRTKPFAVAVGAR